MCCLQLGPLHQQRCGMEVAVCHLWCRSPAGPSRSPSDLPITRTARPRSGADVSGSKGSESGQTTMIMALLLGTFLFGFVALAVDLGSLFQAKRMAQSAADAAAVAAAERYGSSTGQQTAAEAIARLNGFDTQASVNPATVRLNSPPTSGSYASGSSSYVEAIVSKPVPTFFMGMVNHTATVTVAARAVAGYGQPSPTCVCLEGGSGMSLYLTNNSELTANGCGIAVNSASSNAVSVVRNSTLSAQRLSTVSTNWYNSSNISNNGQITPTTRIVQGASMACKPPMPTPPVYSAALCSADPQTKNTTNGAVYSVGPGAANGNTQNGNLVCYSSLSVGKNNSTVTLNPGIYVIDGGDLHFYNSNGGVPNYGGNGVYFYLTGGASLTVDKGANVNVTAMTSGTYSGVLIQQDTANTSTISIEEGSNTIFNGAIYAPSAALTIGSGSGGTVNGPVVAKSLSIDQGGTLTANPVSNLGTMNTSVAKLTE